MHLNAKKQPNKTEYRICRYSGEKFIPKVPWQVFKTREYQQAFWKETRKDKTGRETQLVERIESLEKDLKKLKEKE